jgi:hypothetical protein
MARIVVGIVAVAVLVAAVIWAKRDDCERACVDAERTAAILFERDELVGALKRVDEVDVRCGCGRFTAGDAPPQYTLAQACLTRLRAEGQAAAIERLRVRARGPILRELLGPSSAGR